MVSVRLLGQEVTRHVSSNLREMFNLLHFLDKVSFPDPVKMAAEYGDGLNKDKLVDLHHLVRPYILRRIKSDVLQALPGKSETIVPVGLSTLQRSLYKQILLDNYDVLASGALKRKSAAARSQLISKVLAEIRRLVQHPYLLKDVEPKFPTREETHRRLVESSGKLYLLDKMLKKLIAGGHRTLIFSTMKLVLDILEDYLLGESINYCRLDGETSLKDRQDAIDRFNGRDDIPVFILTTRAGGLGINLTSADSVIIWDSDWNPHQDLQALARAHRIGQERHVGVWKFVTKGTAEERIFQIAKKKLILDHLVVQKLEEETLDEKDVEGVLRFGAEQLFAEEGENTNNEMTIVYDDAAVDKLLERTEDEKPQETTKKASSFSFARVWVTTSADTHAPQETHVEGGDEVPLELGETETDMQESEEMGDAFWQRLLEGRVNKTQAQSAKGKRTRKEVDYATPSKRKRRPKGADAGQDVEESDGDDGFSPLKSSDDEGEEEEGSGSEEGSMDNEDTPLRGDVTDLSMLDDYLRDADDPEVCVACRTKCGNSLENDADGCMIPFSERGDVIARLPEARDQLSSNVRLLTEMLIRRVTERDEIFRFHLKHGRNIYSSLEGLYPPAVDVLATPPGADAGPLDVAAQSDVITTDAQPVLP